LSFVLLGSIAETIEAFLCIHTYYDQNLDFDLLYSVLTKFELLSQHLPGMQNPSRIADGRGLLTKPGTLKFEAENATHPKAACSALGIWA
jgi:hypothetical protein